MKQLLIGFFLFITVQNLYGWGNKGHSEVVRLATELLHNRTFGESQDKINNLNYFERDKLIYYTLVPDIVWYSDTFTYPKGYSKYDEKVCHGPNFLSNESFEKFPASLKTVKKFVLEKLNSHGTILSKDKNFLSAPDKSKIKHYIVYETYHQTELAGIYRIFQLSSLVSEKLKTISDNKIYQLYLENLGFLSHYLGDLNMPLHASPYFYGNIEVGYNTHKYIENNIINNLDHRDWEEIYQKALEKFSFYLDSQDRKNLFDILMYDMAQSLSMIPEINKADQNLEGRKSAANATRLKVLMKEALVNTIASTAQVYLFFSGFNEVLNVPSLETLVNQKSDNFKPIPEWIVPDLPSQESLK